MSTIIKIPGVHQPTSSRNRSSSGNNRMANGIKLGFCRICTCFNLEFIATRCGIIKLFEIILGSCCETLMIRFGIPASQDIGEAFFSFHSTVSACLTTTLILYLSYLFSAKTYNLLRKSVFDLFFSLFASFLYISSSSYLGFSSEIFSYTRFFSSSSYVAFPAMQCVYYVGGVLGIVYAMDGYVAFQELRGS